MISTKKHKKSVEKQIDKYCKSMELIAQQNSGGKSINPGFEFLLDESMYYFIIVIIVQKLLLNF